MTDHHRDTERPSTQSRRPRHIQAPPYVTHKPRQIGAPTVKILLAAVSTAILAATGVGYSTIGTLNHQLAQASGLDLGKQPDGATDILLVGIDSRTDAQGKPLSKEEISLLRAGEEEATNTDTMILIRVPNDGSSATAVSLPRDTYVATNDGNMKLNGVYGTTKFNREQELAKAGDTDPVDIAKKSTEAGRKALIKAVADLSGITVDHYAEVGLLGFVLLTDAVGGVDVCLNEAVHEPLSGANFPKGYQTLNGADALSFVRQRHELPRGDLDRITRQQAYMASLANHVLSSKTLTNPSSLNRINDAVKRSVVLDDGWDIMGMATQMQNLAGGNVSFQTIPVTSIDGTGDYGESIVTVDRDQVHRFFANLASSQDKDKPEPGSATTDPSAPIEAFTAQDYTIDVLNGGDVQGLAATVGGMVESYGYRLGEVGNAAGTGVSESQVNAKSINDPAARALARQLGGLTVVEDQSLDDKEISVTLSGSYSGPGVFGPVQLQDPNSEFAGTLTPGIKDMNGDGIADSAAGTTTTPGVAGARATPPSSVVGTEGTPEGNHPSPSFNAGSNAPMCVN